MSEELLNKTFFKKYGFFIAILCVLSGILIYSVKLSSKSWNKYLQISMNNVLEEYFPDTWTVGSGIQINNPFALNSALFEIRNRKTGTVSKAIIIRIQSIYGPIPAVYLIEDEDVTFVGYSSVSGRIKQQLESSSTNKSVLYWKKKIPQIIK